MINKSDTSMALEQSSRTSSLSCEEWAVQTLYEMIANPETANAVACSIDREAVLHNPLIQSLVASFRDSTEMNCIVLCPSGEIVGASPLAKQVLAESGFSMYDRVSTLFSFDKSDSVFLRYDKSRISAVFNNRTNKVGSEDAVTNVELTATEFADRELSLLVVHIKDCNDQKRFEYVRSLVNRERKLILNAINDPVVITDTSLNILFYNNYFAEMSKKRGYEGDLHMRKLTAVAQFITGKIGLEYKFVISSKEPLKTSIKYGSGSDFVYYEVEKTPIVIDGVVEKIVTILRDRTTQYDLEMIKKDAFFQIEKNMEQFAILNDHIRNPLQAIVGTVDIYNYDHKDEILENCNKIDEIINRLDIGWLESDKIRDMLSRHYGLKVRRRPNVDSPLASLWEEF